MFLAELLLLSCPWRESTADDGKKYYYHARTKQSVWVKPKVSSLVHLAAHPKELEDIEKLIAAQSAPDTKQPSAAAAAAAAAVPAPAAATNDDEAADDGCVQYHSVFICPSV
jgi:pre-mRNA-processing factor 40